MRGSYQKSVAADAIVVAIKIPHSPHIFPSTKERTIFSPPLINIMRLIFLNSPALSRYILVADLHISR